MALIQCAGCQSKFDVSGMAPGVKFKCGTCGAVLQLPGGEKPPRRPSPRPAAKPAAPRRPAAAKPTTPRRPAAATARPSSRRPEPRKPRRGAAVAATSQPASRSRRSRRGADHEDDLSRGPNLTLLLGGIGAGAILIVVLVLAFVGGEPPVEPEHGPAAEEQEQEQVAPPAPAPKTLAEQTLEMKLEILGAGAAKNLVRLESLHGDAVRLPSKENSDLAARTALKVNGETQWAREALGYRRYTGQTLPDEDDFVMYPTPDYKACLAAKEEGWVTAERYADLEKAEARFLAHQKKVDTDAHYRKVCQYRGMIAKHPIFASWDYTTVECRPYLVFVQKSDDPKQAAKLGEKAQEKAAIFRRLYDTFYETFGGSYGLPKLESDVYEKDVILRAWVFADRKSFDKYHKSIGRPMGNNVGAYYSPADQWMIIPEGVAKGMKVPGQDMDTNVTIHEATHQLIHCLTKMLVEKDLGEELVWTDSRLGSKSHWFQEGIAE